MTERINELSKAVSRIVVALIDQESLWSNFGSLGLTKTISVLVEIPGFPSMSVTFEALLPALVASTHFCS